MKPANDISLIQRLAAEEETCSFFAPVLVELHKNGLDTADLRAIIQTELGETHCFKSKPTEKYHPQTISDYYLIWIDECQHRMFIKLLVATQGSSQMLVITSFKRDTSHGF
jgi:hypothetical protein